MQTPDALHQQSSSASCSATSSTSNNMHLPPVSADSAEHHSDELPFPPYASDGDVGDDDDDDDVEEDDGDDDYDDAYPEPQSTSETRHLIAVADNARPPPHQDEFSTSGIAVHPLERRHRTTAGHGRPRRLHAYTNGGKATASAGRQLRRHQRAASKLYSPLTVFTLTIVFLLFLYIPLFNTFRESSGMCEC